MNEQLWWFVARASGMVAWVLVAAAILWGLSLSGRITRRPRPAWVLDLHRFLGLLAVVFTAVHLAGLVADSYAHFGPAELFLPLASSWRPGPVTWGIVGFYLLVAIEVTSLLMRRLPRRLWRGVHLTSYALYVVATVHLFTAGTDAANPIVQWTALAVSVVIVNLTVVRTFSRPERPAANRSGPRTLVGMSAGLQDAAAGVGRHERTARAPAQGRHDRRG